jgi:hypothetical protein
MRPGRCPAAGKAVAVVELVSSRKPPARGLAELDVAGSRARRRTRAACRCFPGRRAPGSAACLPVSGDLPWLSPRQDPEDFLFQVEFSCCGAEKSSGGENSSGNSSGQGSARNGQTPLCRPARRSRTGPWPFNSGSASPWEEARQVRAGGGATACPLRPRGSRRESADGRMRGRRRYGRRSHEIR